MHRPVCVKDQVEFRCSNNEVDVLDTSGESQRAYKLWSADEFTCPVCHTKIVVGFGNRPVVQHFEDGFDAKVEKRKEWAANSNCTEFYYNHEYPKRGELAHAN